MADDRPFRYLATFQDPEQAEADFAAVSALHRAGLLGTSGAALITRDRSGEVWLSTGELSAERGAVLGALAGGVTGPLRAGLPRRELRVLAVTLAPGEAAVVVVGDSRLEEALRRTGKRAARLFARRREEVRQINRQREAARHTAA